MRGRIASRCSRRFTAHCPACGGRLRYRYDNRHTVTTLAGLVRLRLRIRRCENPACVRHHRPYRPEAEGALVLPQHEFGLDVIALVGALRYREHRERAGDPPRPARARRGGLPSAPSPTCSTATTSWWRPPWPTTTGCGRSWPGRGGRSWRSTACSRTSATRSCGSCASACRARSCSPGACCPRRARTWPRCCARSPRGSACRSPAWSATASTRSAGRCGWPCPGCRTSCASSTTCARRRSRSSRPTATPRRS